MADDQTTQGELFPQAPKRRWAASSRRKRERWLAAGLCASCGRARDNDALTCTACLEKMRERGRAARAKVAHLRRPKAPRRVVPEGAHNPVAYKAAKRAAWDSAGVCTKCGEPRDEAAFKSCAACRAAEKASRLRHRAERKRRLEAGVPTPPPEMTTADMKAYRTAWRVKARAAGLCSGCGAPQDTPDCFRCSKCLARDRRRYARNPEAAKSALYRRRSRLADAGTFTKEEWEAVKARYGHRCLMCGRREPEVKLTVDHVFPLSKGGSNTADNLAPLCSRCNKSKGARLIDPRPDAE